MEYPPIGQEVLVTTDNDEQIYAVWNGEYWEVGIEDNSLQFPLEKIVISWKWRTE